MKISGLALRRLQIPFRVSFKHASAERKQTDSAWATVRTVNGIEGYGESCPRPYVTGETWETVNAFFQEYREDLRRAVDGLPALQAWVQNHRVVIDKNPAGFCALELALLDALAKEQGVAVERLLNLPDLKGIFVYSAVIGDGSLEQFEQQLGQYLEMGFRDFKIKISGEAAGDKGKLTLLQDNPGLRVRVDANNLWDETGVAAAYFKDLGQAVFAIEEPLGPNQYSELSQLASVTDAKIILDESLLRREQVETLPGDPEQWIINVRVSKMGGILRSLEVIEAARERGTRVVVGAQVGETSLLTRAGLTVAHAGKDILEAQEGAFGTLLLENDPCQPTLMFGEKGELDVEGFKLGDGLGLTIRTHRPFA